MQTRTLVPAVAGLVVLAATALGAGTAYSALTDGADLVATSLAPAADPATGVLDVATIDPRGVVSTGPGAAELVPIPGDDSMTPGRTVRLQVGVADNDPDTAAAVAVSVLPMGDDGSGRV